MVTSTWVLLPDVQPPAAPHPARTTSNQEPLSERPSIIVSLGYLKGAASRGRTTRALAGRQDGRRHAPGDDGGGNRPKPPAREDRSVLILTAGGGAHRGRRRRHD